MLLTTSQLDNDNLFPNPSSEIDPPPNTDTATSAEFANRVNAGAGAYSGSWVRQISAAMSGCWVPCSPGALFYFEAQTKRVSGAGSGGRLNVGFYPTLGSFSSGTVTNGAYSTSGSWTKVSVTSAAAPAGTNAAYISYEAASGDTIQWDSLYARRVMQPEAIASEVITPQAASNWTLSGVTVRKVGALVHGLLVATAALGASWTLIAAMPVGARPVSTTLVYGKIISGASVYLAEFYFATNGNLVANAYDDGTSINQTLPTIAAGSQAILTFLYVAF